MFLSFNWRLDYSSLQHLILYLCGHIFFFFLFCFIATKHDDSVEYSLRSNDLVFRFQNYCTTHIHTDYSNIVFSRAALERARSVLIEHFKYFNIFPFRKLLVFFFRPQDTMIRDKTHGKFEERTKPQQQQQQQTKKL